MNYQYDHYFIQEERKKIICELAKKYPDIFSYEVILKTEEDKEVFVVTITNTKTNKASDKPAFYIDGNTHAGEVTGMMSAMYTMDYLCSNYQNDEKITYLLDNYTIYINPCVSPDGSDTYLLTPYMLRSVNRVNKEAKKGLIKKDIDRDGVIRMMRVKSSYGNFKKDPNNPELMVVREADDLFGEFYYLFTEGEFIGYQENDLEVALEEWSLDFNRNYPYGWFSDFRQYGAGEYPLSNKETKAVVDFVINHPNICSALTYHTSGGILLCPPGTYSSKKAPYFDIEVYKAIGKICEKTLGYKYVNIFDGFMSDQEAYDSGAFDDWCYETKGVYTTTLELWNIEERANHPHKWGQFESLSEQLERYGKCYKWVMDNCPENYQPWTKFNHPQLGEIEIGGFNSKVTFQNPPISFLENEINKACQFSLGFATILPNIVVESATKKDLGGNNYQVDLVLGNTGYLPTYISEKAKMINVDTKIFVKVDNEVLGQDNIIEVKDLLGFSNINSSAMYYGNIDTEGKLGNKQKISFICHQENNQPINIEIFGKKIKKINLSI